MWKESFYQNKTKKIILQTIRTSKTNNHVNNHKIINN